MNMVLVDLVKQGTTLYQHVIFGVTYAGMIFHFLALLSVICVQVSRTKVLQELQEKLDTAIFQVDVFL